MKIYAVTNQKGGTGKTTTAAAITQAAARNGQRTLAIDLDPQGNLSFLLAADTSRAGSFEMLTGGAAAADVIQEAGGFSIIPAAWSLQTITSARGSARRLQDALEPIKAAFDVIVIDTPPTAGELQYNALQAATGLLIPLQATAFDLQALYQVIDTAEQIRRSNPDLKYTGVILTRYTGRSIIARHMRDTIKKQAEAAGVPYLGEIRQGVAIPEAEALQRSLFDYAPRSNPAADYLGIYEKIMEQEGKQHE